MANFEVRAYIYHEMFDTFTSALKYAWKISKNQPQVCIMHGAAVIAEINDCKCMMSTKYDPPSPW